MCHFISNRKHFLIWLIGLTLISSFFWVATPTAAYADTTVLTFTSDIHNASDNIANNRLDRWLDIVKDQYGDIEAMSFCGDMGTDQNSGDVWWSYVETVMNTVSSKTTDNGKELPGVYTTGNHEFKNGVYGTSNASPYQQQMEEKYIVSDEGREGDNYIIYCVGTETWENQVDRFTANQLSALDTFLSGAGNDKPIIVLAHFPLHRWQSNRRTESADAMIDILNAAVARGQKIIFLWGHNHSRSDTNYDEIFLPGSPIEYISGTTKTIDFIYAAAGCMSDTEYVGSSTVKGKGLVITINDKKQVAMTYLDAYGNNVTEGGTYTEQDPVDVTGVSVDPTEASIEVRKNVQLKATVEPKDATNKAVTWSSSDTSVAKVDQNGKVRGIREGKVTITATTEDGGMTAECTVTITPSSTPVNEYVIKIGGFALSTEPTDDQYTNSSGSRRYYYTGLDGVEYPVEGDVPDNIRWIIEETDGGYYIISLDGRYLNATYETNDTGGKTGTLKLDDTPDVWTLDGSLDDWEISGSKLKSTNAGKSMTHEESSSPSGGSAINLFTVRSEGESSELIDTTEHKLTKTDAVEATCTTAGNSAYWTCSDCGKYFSDENGQTRIKENSWVIDALGHDMTEHKAVAATCEEAGNSAYWSCGRCKKFFSDANGENEIEENSWVLAALNHKWDDGKVTTEPTCTTAGVKTFTCQNDSAHTYTEEIAMLGHDLTAHKAVAATCEEAGNSAYWSCGRCGKFYSDAEGENEIKENSWVIAALGHDWGEGTVTKPATCEEAGERSFTCQNDPSHTKTEEIKALGHDWGDGEVTKPATCEEDGVRTYICKNDPSHMKTEKIAALGHNWDSGTVTTAATCTETGVRTYTCQNDPSHTRTETIAALGHRLTAHRAVAVTCEADGNTAYWSCSRCKKFFSDAEGKNEIEENSWVVEALGHKWDEGKVTTEPTCTTAGVKTFTCQNDSSHTYTEEIAALGHDMTEHKAVAATCEEAGNSAYWSCERCGKFFSDEEGTKEIRKNSWVINALGHDWGDGEVTKPATCEEAGVRSYTCKNDPSHTKTEEIAALGHDWDEGEVTTEPTCTTAGVKSFVCQNDKSHTKTEEIAALGHELTRHRRVSATCTEDGNTAYWSCSRCKKFFSDAEAKNEIEENSWVIPALGHNWNEGEVTTEPTCTTAGVKKFTCQNNWAHTKTEEIPALGHNLTEHKAVSATCTEAGNSAYWSCERCGKFFSDAEGTKEIEKDSWVIDALGHDWDEGEITRPATCTTAGARTYTCQNDPSHTRTETIAALGHNMTEHQAVAATCEEAGNSAYWSCDRCSKFFSDANGENEIKENSWVIAALGHKWAWGRVIREATCTEPGLRRLTCQNNWAHTTTEEIAPLGHNMTAHEAVSETCDTAGNSAYWSCDRCKKFFSDAEGENEIEENSWVIEALGHNMTEHKAVAATCTEAGNSAYWSCDRCKKFFSDAEGKKEIKENGWVINALGHKPVEIPAILPTCEETGSTAGEKCSVCGEILTAPEELAAIGHKWNEGQVTTEPTCTEKGVRTYTCQNDITHTRTEVIAALGHDLQHHDAKAASCTEIGWEAYDTCSRCDYTTYKEIAALGHDLQHHDAKAASCTEIGWEAYDTCSRCDYTTYKEIKALGHKWGEWTVTKPATEEEEGEETRTCSRCEKKETRAIPKLNHEHSMTKVEAVAPTCTEDGNIEYWQCEKCKRYYSKEAGGDENELNAEDLVVKATGHKAVDDPKVEATCTEDGKTAGSHCSVCGTVFVAQETIPATGHSWNKGKVTTEPTCTKAGEKTFTCLNDPSHTKTEEIAPLGHDMTEHKAVSATCEKAGNSAYWSCERCEKFFSDAEGMNEIKENSWVLEALGHDWGEWEVTKPATEEEEGEEARTCSRCEKKETRVIPKLNHEHSMKKVEAVASTCTEDGNIEYWQCEKCKRYYSKEAGGDENELNVEDLVVKATGHKVVDDPKEEATCTEDGKTAGSHCSACGTVIVAQETIPATGHKWDEGKVTTEPTCTKAGEKTFTCLNDPSHTKTEDIAALGHDLEHHDAKAASCTEIGWDAYDACSRCDYTTYKEIKALGHKWGEWEITKPATEEEEGEEARTCSRCEKKETRAIPKLEPSVEPIPVSPGGNQSSQTGRDGTAVGPGASAEVAEQAITSMKTDGDPKGAVFSKLTVRSPKQTKNSIKLKWKKVSKATSYVIYGNKCGTKNKPKKLASVSGNTKTFKKILKRKLQKGTYYKFIIVAIDKDQKVVSTSKLIHVATKGGKVGNHKSVSVKKSVLNNARRMKVGSSLKLKAKAVPQSAKKKVKKHVAIRYESTNKKVATVSGKGIVKARKKGTCYIYAYAQSGVYKRIKVIVK